MMYEVDQHHPQELKYTITRSIPRYTNGCFKNIMIISPLLNHKTTISLWRTIIFINTQLGKI